MSGAAQAQALAQNIELGTTLGGQKAEGALSQADLEAALAREALGLKSDARISAVERESTARAAAAEEERQNKIRIAELALDRAYKVEEMQREDLQAQTEREQYLAGLRTQAQIDYANKLMGMSPEDREAFLGQSSTAEKVQPSWYGTRFPGNATSAIKGITNSDSGDKLPVLIGTANRALDRLDSALEDPQATGAKAFSFWVNFYADQDPYILNQIYPAAKRPNSAGEMLKQLKLT